MATAADAAVAVSQRDDGDGARHVDHESRAWRWRRLARAKKRKLEWTRVEKEKAGADEANNVAVLLSPALDEAEREAGPYGNATIAMVVAMVAAGVENKRRVGLIDS